MKNLLNKIEMLATLRDVGFLIPHYDSLLGKDLNDYTLANYLNARRANTQYEIDGLVLDVNLAAKRQQMNPTRDTLNPAYAVKFKIADTSNYAETEVVDIEWNVSKHGYLKPRVKVKPTNLVGATIQYATGFNAKFIYDNKIQPGTVVAITRSGDVIPYILRVVTPGATDYGEWFKSQLDNIGPWKWNETGVDVIIDDHHENDEVRVNLMTDFFTSIDVPMLRKGNVIKLYEYRRYDVSDIIRLPERMFVSIIGENGKKIYAGLRSALTNIPLWKLMGSTHFFGRGVGRRKMKKLINALGHEGVFTGTASDFARVESFDEKTGKKIANGMDAFLDWLRPLEEDGYISVDYSTTAEATGAEATGNVANLKFCFTGFRNKNLQTVIEAQGGTVASSVSKNTNYVVTNNPNGTSTKLKKARELNIPIITEADLQQMV